MMNRFKEIRKAERRNLSNVQYTAREPAFVMWCRARDPGKGQVRQSDFATPLSILSH